MRLRIHSIGVNENAMLKSAVIVSQDPSFLTLMEILGISLGVREAVSTSERSATEYKF